MPPKPENAAAITVKRASVTVSTFHVVGVLYAEGDESPTALCLVAREAQGSAAQVRRAEPLTT